MLRKDKEEVEAIKHAKALEAEKAMYSVRIFKHFCCLPCHLFKPLDLFSFLLLLFFCTSGPAVTETAARV